MKNILLKFSLFLSIALLVITPISYADTANGEIIYLDGREVLLNENGSWTYLSTDRYANTKDGIRIRLKEDGSWQTIGNAPLKSDEQVRTTDLDMQLQKVVIETYKKKSQKNVKVKTQTVFYIDLAYSQQATSNIVLSKEDIALIEVKDNNGKVYPIVSINPGAAELKPNSTITLVVRAEKSPSVFDTVKSMTIEFKQGVLNLKSPVRLSQRLIDFGEKNVTGFTKHD